jgi:cytochrome c556
MKTFAKLFAAATVLLSPAALSAQDVETAVSARKATMQLYSFYLGQLGAMAKGEVEYDAEAAGKAATSLASLAGIDQSKMWPQGSGNDVLGEKTRALPAIWATYPAVVEKSMALSTTSAALAEVAGGGLEAMRAAVGPVGQSCGGCHEDFRQPKE